LPDENEGEGGRVKGEEMVKVLLLLMVVGVGAQAPDAATHKAWMNDATDLQEDIRDAMGAKSGAKIAEAATKIEDLMAKTEAYWSAKKAADVVKLAQTARAHAKDVVAAGKAGKLDQAAEAFGRLNTTCNTCHDLHPEKR
jgi:hypothetical protein